jgi:hypothetical protein
VIDKRSGHGKEALGAERGVFLAKEGRVMELEGKSRWEGEFNSLVLLVFADSAPALFCSLSLALFYLTTCVLPGHGQVLFLCWVLDTAGFFFLPMGGSTSVLGLGTYPSLIAIALIR